MCIGMCIHLLFYFERAVDAASMTAVQFLQMHRALCLCSDASNVRSSVSVVTRLQTGLTGLDSQQ